MIMSELTTALAILSAMITPAVLVSACGSLILTTSQRLSRVIDRTRKVADQLEQLATVQQDDWAAKERAMRFEQLGHATQRSQLLQRAMACLYLALSVFVAISLAIGVVALLGVHYTWIPITLGFIGAGLLFYASLLLISESRIAVGAVNDEMRFIIERGQQLVPATKQSTRRRPSFALLHRAKQESVENKADHVQ